MKVRLLVARSGADGADNIGDIVEVSKDECKRMIESNQCVPYVPEVKPETRKNVAKGKGKK